MQRYALRMHIDPSRWIRLGFHAGNNPRWRCRREMMSAVKLPYGRRADEGVRPA